MRHAVPSARACAARGSGGSSLCGLLQGWGHDVWGRPHVALGVEVRQQRVDSRLAALWRGHLQEIACAGVQGCAHTHTHTSQ